MDGAARDHDSLEFQRGLRGDRKLLAAFYTTQSAATLLADLALARRSPLRVADFACGAGALLAAVHRRIAPRACALFGYDVVAEATRRAAARVPSARAVTLPYGMQPDGRAALGAIGLLRDGDDASFDLVIMNPPYTRATGHEAEKIGVPVPMFAALGSSVASQRAMAKAFRRATRGTCAHGNAGEASAFLALGHAKLREGGRLALVMPLSLLAGEAWRRSRALLRASYRDLIVVTIANVRASFSADTAMAECLIVGTKARRGEGRATFVTLEHAPADEREASRLARAIDRGEDRASTLVTPLPNDDGPWSFARVRDLSLARFAHALASGAVRGVPVAPLATRARVGPYHMDVTGTEIVGGAPRGPFDVRPRSLEAKHPMLWAHDADAERTMMVTPDAEASAREGTTPSERATLRVRAKAIASTASHAHVNRDFRFNSQSLAAAFTATPTIGGRAWPSVIFEDVARAKAFTLWSNSTLGVLLHWWTANKPQDGRGSVPVTALRDLPTLDLGVVSRSHVRAMARAFDDLATRALAPIHEIDRDEGRFEIDRRVLAILDLGYLHARLREVRRALAREPSIVGTKMLSEKAPGRRARRSRVP